MATRRSSVGSSKATGPSDDPGLPQTGSSSRPAAEPALLRTGSDFPHSGSEHRRVRPAQPARRAQARPRLGRDGPAAISAWSMLCRSIARHPCHELGWQYILSVEPIGARGLRLGEPDPAGRRAPRLKFMTTSQIRDLTDAREALRAGMLSRALEKAWSASVVAVRTDDEDGLQAVLELASTIQDRAIGRNQKDARRLAVYCSHCLSDLREGVRQPSPLMRFLRPPK